MTRKALLLFSALALAPACGAPSLDDGDLAEAELALPSTACSALRWEIGRLPSGQTIETLAKKELTGTQDVWSRYVQFSRGASAVASFRLPSGVDPAGSLAVRVNYRGPRKSATPWQFEALTTGGTWEAFADNGFAADWRWTRTSLPLPGPASRYSVDGVVSIRYRALNKREASLLDELVLELPISDAGTSPSPSPDAGTPPPATSPDAGTSLPPTDPATSPDAGSPSTPPPGGEVGADAGTPAPTPEADAGTTTSPDAGTPPAPPAAGIWRPAPGTRWQWQLTGTVDTSVDAQVFDIDLFDVSQATIDLLHSRGKKVVCYFSAGSYENWRPDAALFPASALGRNLDGWPGERWLDHRDAGVRDIMRKRLDLAVSKRCDGVEPDNVDGYTNSPGFPLTAADQLSYNRFLAAEAHARGLSIALKNDLDQVRDLVKDFDFAVNEECFRYSECEMLQPFIAAGKAVFSVEYGGSSLATTVCPKANALDFDTLIKNLDLDAWRVTCR